MTPEELRELEQKKTAFSKVRADYVQIFAQKLSLEDDIKILEDQLVYFRKYL